MLHCESCRNSFCLTHDVGAEGHRLHLPTIIVEGQVPGASVQVLDKDGLVEDHSLDAPPFTRRLNNAPLLLPVQALHIIILGGAESLDLNGEHASTIKCCVGVF